MALNANLVQLGDETLVDLTGDTVAPETLMEGATAHDKAGNPITGTAKQGGGVQSDWAENDPQSPAYVKNRFGGYEEVSEEAIFPEHKFDFENYGPLFISASTGLPTFPKIGTHLNVTWDSKKYNVETKKVATADGELPGFGNIGILNAGMDTGEPFLCMFIHTPDNDLWYFYTKEQGTSHNIALSKVSKSIIKIPAKYLSTFLDDKFDITFTSTQTGVTSDKNFQALENAILNGKEVNAKFVYDKDYCDIPKLTGYLLGINNNLAKVTFTWIMRDYGGGRPFIRTITVDHDSSIAYNEWGA